VGDAVSAARLNTEISTALNFWLNPPLCSVYMGTTGVTCANATTTLATYDSETDDTDNMHSTVTNTSRITFNTAGRYEIVVTNAFLSGTLTQYDIQVRLNGVTSLRTFSFGSPGGASFTQICQLARVFAVADYIEVQLTQTSGGSRICQTAGQYSSGVQARWVSAT
jgi:hypothetical protein